MAASGAVRAATCFFAVAIAASCAWSRAADPARDEVKVEVASVGLDSETGAHFVLLADQSGKRTLPIVIGDTEARAIMLELHGIKAERPLTHDLLRSAIEQTGNHVDRVVIGDLRDQTYYAAIYLDRGRYHLDSRPSDAIALALGANAPIYVANRLFEAGSAIERPAGLPEIGRGLGMIVQELTPQLAAALGEPPHSGVLVSGTSKDLAHSGIERGDVITAVGGKPVKTLGDFEQHAAALKSGERTEIALKRGSGAQIVTLKVPAATGENH
jgi:uncharacterized protein